MKILLVLLIVAASFAGVSFARYGSTTDSQGTSTSTNIDNATTWDNRADNDADNRMSNNRTSNRMYNDNSTSDTNTTNSDTEYR